MFNKVTTVLKYQAHPLVVLSTGLSIVLLLTALTGMWHYQSDLAKRPVLTAPEPQKKQRTQITNATLGAESGQIVSSEPTQTSGSEITKPPAQSAAPRTSPGQTSIQRNASTSDTNPATVPLAPTTVTISLTVNGKTKGTVRLPSGSNNCQVLSQALQDGLISSLDMRYNEQLKTYAIYVIDGVGDSGSVWWVYTVNGKSPPYGCSGQQVQGGDWVEWKYIKN